MINSDQLQDGYMKQGPEEMLKFVNAIYENWVSILRQADGVGAEVDAQRALAHSLFDASAPAVRATEQRMSLMNLARPAQLLGRGEVCAQGTGPGPCRRSGGVTTS